MSKSGLLKYKCTDMKRSQWLLLLLVFINIQIYFTLNMFKYFMEQAILDLKDMTYLKTLNTFFRLEIVSLAVLLLISLINYKIEQFFLFIKKSSSKCTGNMHLTAVNVMIVLDWLCNSTHICQCNVFFSFKHMIYMY